MPAIILKKCNKCGGEWPLEACYRKRNENLRLSTLRHDQANYQSTCVMCEITERNDPTPEERAKRKAQNSIDRHAQKLNMKPNEFAKQFGWHIDRMVYDITHGLENTCPYCWELYSAMGHGLSDITLDVVDPQKEPYYRTNTKWCCSTCNSEKSRMAPHLWEQRLIIWPQYMAWRNKVRNDPTHGLPLFAERTLFE
jgi:hypothetical protein